MEDDVDKGYVFAPVRFYFDDISALHVLYDVFYLTNAQF